MTNNKLAAAFACALSLTLLPACTKNYYTNAGSSSSSSSSSSSGSSSSSSSSSGSSSSSSSSSSSGSGSSSSSSSSSSGGSSSSGAAAVQVLKTSVDTGVVAAKSTINQGTAIGKGGGGTPFTLTNLAADPNNSSAAKVNTAPFTPTNPQYTSVGTVPDTAAGFCNYSGATPVRVDYSTGSGFETTAPGTTGADPMVPMAPFYFPLVYTTTLTSGNAFGGKPAIIGLFDWRPKDIDEAVVAAESDDNGQTWFFMQTVLELFPDYTNPNAGGSGNSTSTGCPATIKSTNGSSNAPLIPAANGNNADNGWGHAAIIQLPGVGNASTGQFLYLLDRGAGIDVNPLFVINLATGSSGNGGASNKFPVWNTNAKGVTTGANDIRSISSALSNTPGAAAAGNAVTVQKTVGLLNPDGIMAVFPTSPTAAAGTTVTVMYVQKILNGDKTGTTALPAAQRCNKAPFSGKNNDDISIVHLVDTVDGINFTNDRIVKGLNDTTTVDYNGTRWISPRGTLIDINGDGSVWGLYFGGGNCLDGDSDAFHYIGYAESTDKVNWTVYNDINSPIASINSITLNNQAGGATVTVPANKPLVETQPWFAQRLYAPTATQIDPTHLSLTFAGYGVQTPNDDLLNYRQIGNVVLTVSKALPTGVPNNINAH